MRLLFIIIVLCVCISPIVAQRPLTFPGQTPRGQQLITLVGVPDHQLNLSIGRLIHIVDTIQLKTEKLPVLSGSIVIKKLLAKDRSYFSNIKSAYGQFAAQLRKDTLLVAYPITTVVESQLDSLLDYASKGFEWPQNCQLFDFNEHRYRIDAGFFPCCTYFRWYDGYQDLEKLIQSVQSSKTSKDPLHTSTGSSKGYYCSTVAELLSPSQIIAAIESFRNLWDTLLFHLAARQERSTVLLHERSSGYYRFISDLGFQLDSLRKISVERLNNSRQNLMQRTRNIDSLDRMILHRTAQISKDSATIAQNDRQLAEVFVQQRKLDETYDQLRHIQDSLIESGNEGIVNIKFDELDNFATQGFYTRSFQTTTHVRTIAEQIRLLREKRSSNRVLLFSLKEQSLRLREDIANAKGEIIKYRILSDLEKEAFFVCQSKFRGEMVETENFITFLNEVNHDFFPQSQPVPGAREIRQQLFRFDKEPFKLNKPDPAYFKRFNNLLQTIGNENNINDKQNK
jgi:hypothetical protein